MGGLAKGLVCLITQTMWEAGGNPKCGQRSMLGATRTVEVLWGLTEREGQDQLKGLRRLWALIGGEGGYSR